MIGPLRPVLRAPAALARALACAEEPRDPGFSSAEPAPSAASADVGSPRLDAEVLVMESFPVQLRGTLRVANPTAAPIAFDVGGCPVFLDAGEVALAVPRQP